MQPVRHGIQYRYRIAGCRCEDCRAWYNAWQRAYRQRRMARTGERIRTGRFISNA